jgi:hypothetical protein
MGEPRIPHMKINIQLCAQVARYKGDEYFQQTLQKGMKHTLLQALFQYTLYWFTDN